MPTTRISATTRSTTAAPATRRATSSPIRRPSARSIRSISATARVMSCTTRTASSSTTTATATMPAWSVRSSPTATPSRIRVSTNRRPKAMLSTVRDISTSRSSRTSSSRSTPAFRSMKPAPPRLRILGSDSSPAKKAWFRKAISGISTSTCSRFSTTPSRSGTTTSM